MRWAHSFDYSFWDIERGDEGVDWPLDCVCDYRLVNDFFVFVYAVS